jgi:hypothetical protein
MVVLDSKFDCLYFIDQALCCSSSMAIVVRCNLIIGYSLFNVAYYSALFVLKSKKDFSGSPLFPTI